MSVQSCPAQSAKFNPFLMDLRGSAAQDECSPATATPSTPTLRRRLSMEDDMLYRNIISTPIRRPTQPSPATSLDALAPYERQAGETDIKTKTTSIGRQERQEIPSVEAHKTTIADDSNRGFDQTPVAPSDEGLESLPQYSNSIALEAVFAKKQEIENVTTRAEDRRWHTRVVILQGTALHVYHIKKDWGWGRCKDGPTVCADYPPWIRITNLEKTYSLLHADAGIAADYKKRRYVIRVRAETDQFLLCCVELSTFIKWLEGLFAAIDVAAPIDDRDFPRDMSIPRIHRIRWFRNHLGAVFPVAVHEPAREASADEPEQDDEPAADPSHTYTDTGTGTGTQSTSPRLRAPTPAPQRPRSGQDSNAPGVEAAPPGYFPRHDRHDHLQQLMMTPSNPNPAIDPHTGKWFPDHRWTSTHDLLYAKLCYSNLLFSSPRKSNYIISKGKQWYVDWNTGKMVRVLPPAYDDDEGYFGPWEVAVELGWVDNRRAFA